MKSSIAMQGPVHQREATGLSLQREKQHVYVAIVAGHACAQPFTNHSLTSQFLAPSPDRSIACFTYIPSTSL